MLMEICDAVRVGTEGAALNGHLFQRPKGDRLVCIMSIKFGGHIPREGNYHGWHQGINIALSLPDFAGTAGAVEWSAICCDGRYECRRPGFKEKTAPDEKENGGSKEEAGRRRYAKASRQEA